MGLQTVFRDDRVGYQRVRRHDAAEQQSGLTRIVEQVDAGVIDHDEGDKKREQSENRHFPEVLLGALHVHFKSGKEHDEIETHLSENFERGIALQYVQSVLPHQHAGQHHSDDVWNAQLGHNHRREQDDAEHDEEDPRGIGDGKIGAEIEHWHVLDFSIRVQR